MANHSCQDAGSGDKSWVGVDGTQCILLVWKPFFHLPRLDQSGHYTIQKQMELHLCNAKSAACLVNNNITFVASSVVHTCLLASGSMGHGFTKHAGESLQCLLGSFYWVH